MLNNILRTKFYTFLVPFWLILPLKYKIGIKYNLFGISLEGMDLSYTNLESVYLKGANLKKVNLTGAHLDYSCLQGADLEGACLYDANLRWADLVSANLKNADLTAADLEGSPLQGADLEGSLLSKACLADANLTGTKGLPTQKELLEKYFAVTEDYVTVYKIIGCTQYSPPPYWKIEEGSFLREVVYTDLRKDCGPGVNFATRKWIQKSDYSGSIWECRIYREDWKDIIMPYNSNGKGRCARLQLVKVIAYKDPVP